MNGRSVNLLALTACLAWTLPLQAAPLKLTLSDPHGLLDEPIAVRKEIGSLLHDAKVELGWTDSVGSAAAATRNEVNIVVTPSLPSGPGWTLEPNAMGVYLTSGGSSAVFVFYRRVLSVLGLPAPGDRLLEPSERRDITRALARVAVHELVHRLVPGLPHAERGIMRGELDRHALTRRRLSLDDATREALVAVITTLAPATASPGESPGGALRPPDESGSERCPRRFSSGDRCPWPSAIVSR